MAEALSTGEKEADKTNSLECAVCLQPCIHPAQLPCGHIFCFLCVKGFANQSKRCAMCRKEIPIDFIEQPRLVEQAQSTEPPEGYDGRYQWFYEGRNGWWQYDERTSKELECSYKKGEKSVELLIAGFLYVIDFENMLQLRRNDPSRRRRIKRDFATIPKKGIAGIRTEPSLSSSIETREIPEIRPASPTDGTVDNTRTIPITPSNTPQTPTSGRESPDQEQDLQATVERISNLRLDDNRNDSSNDSTEESEASSSQQFRNVRWRGHHLHPGHMNDD